MLIRNGVYSRFDFRPRALLPPHLRAWKAGASAIKSARRRKIRNGRRHWGTPGRILRIRFYCIQTRTTGVDCVALAPKEREKGEVLIARTLNSVYV